MAEPTSASAACGPTDTVASPESGKRQAKDKERNTKAESTHEHLNTDYSGIAQLMSELNKEVESFSKNMDVIVKAVPAHDGLAALWESHAINQDVPISTEGTKEKDAEIKPDVALEDDEEDQSDQLIFL